MENTGSREYLGNNDYGLLTKAQDVPDFVDNLKKMMSQPALRHHYAHQSLERASHFSPETIVSQWMPIIKDINQPVFQLLVKQARCKRLLHRLFL